MIGPLLIAAAVVGVLVSLLVSRRSRLAQVASA